MPTNADGFKREKEGIMKKVLPLLFTILLIIFTLALVSCGETHEHSYVAVVTKPTVTEQGYTTYTCECGDSYVDDYTPILVPSEGLEFTLKDDGKSYSITGIGTCTDTDVIIPNEHNGLPVTSIGYPAFFNCQSLTSIIISNSVTSIGELAFSHCRSLSSVEIPNSVTSIGNFAFQSCTSLTSIVIPHSVTSIGDKAFLKCYSLIEAINKSSLNVVAGSSDYGYVGYYAKQVITDESQSAIKIVGDYIFYDDGTDIYLVEYIGKNTEITLPEYDGGKKYEIWNHAFYSCTYLTSVVIGDFATSIGIGAFCECTSLTSVEIPYSVTSIADEAFVDCISLTSIVIPNSVTSISDSTFGGCTSLTSIVIPDSVTSIAMEAFAGCISLTSIVIPNSVTSINDGTFGSCTSLTSIVIPDSVTSIGMQAFADCISLTSIEYLGTVEQWNDMEKRGRWNLRIPATEVVCSNGTVKIHQYPY